MPAVIRAQFSKLKGSGFFGSVSLIVLQLLVFIPLVIFAGNPDEFGFGLLELSPLALASVAVVILSAGIFTLLFGRYLEPLRILSIAAALGIAMQSIFLVWSYGQFDGADINWGAFATHGWWELGAWGALFIAVCYWRTALSSGIWKICAAVSLIHLVGALPAIFAGSVPAIRQSGAAKFEQIFSFSPQSNTVIIVLDTLQGPAFDKLLERQPDLETSLRGFTYYPNTTASFPSTLPSVPSILTGEPYSPSGSISEYFNQVFAQRSLPARFRELGHAVSMATLPGFCQFFPAGECGDHRRYPEGTLAGRAAQEYFELLDYALFRSSPHVLKPWLYNGDSWRLREIFASQNAGPKVDGTVRFVQRVVAEMRPDSSQPTFKFIHLLLPHPPLRVDAQCNLLRSRPKLNREGYLDQAQCAFNQMLSILGAMKRLGVYENSTIVIAADHGLSLDFGTNDIAQARQRGLPAISRALPMLLVKRAAAVEPFRRSNSPAQLIDIARTVFPDTQGEALFPGEDLQQLLSDARRERIFTDYALRWAGWKDASQQQTAVEAPQYIVRGDARNLDSWSRR